jgi:hypothetical protein
VDFLPKKKSMKQLICALVGGKKSHAHACLYVLLFVQSIFYSLAIWKSFGKPVGRNPVFRGVGTFHREYARFVMIYMKLNC